MKQLLTAAKPFYPVPSGLCLEHSWRTAWLAAAMSLPVTAALAVDTTLTQGGFTGLSITPNAHLLPWGQFGATYDNQLPGISNPSGHNFVMGFGLLPNVEVVGRLAASELQSNCFTQGCGAARDLSASFKAGIGLDAAATPGAACVCLPRVSGCQMGGELLWA